MAHPQDASSLFSAANTDSAEFVSREFSQDFLATTQKDPQHLSTAGAASYSSATLSASISVGGSTTDSPASLEFSTLSEGNASKTTREAKSSYLLSAKERKRNSILEETITAGRLNFKALDLYGRDKEKEILQNCIERTVNSQGAQRELVLIDGFSGTGKTALAATLEPRAKKHNGLFVRGKFDQFHNDSSAFEGITAACLQICGKLLALKTSDPRTFFEIQAHLCTEIDPDEEMVLLIRLIPELADVVIGGGNSVNESKGYAAANSLQETDIGSGQINEQFKFRIFRVFSTFIRIMSTHFAPLVIVIDDMQWATKDACELLGALIRVDHQTDTKSKLLLVGLYRSEEVEDESHRLSMFIRDLKEKQQKYNYKISDISIGNLELSSVNQFITELLSVDDPNKTRTLTKICHKRTLGNPFFLTRFLIMLRQQKHIRFNLGSYKWEWDDRKVSEATIATENVVTMLRNNLDHVPPYVANRLSVAACLGVSFKPVELDMVWTQVSSDFLLCDGTSAAENSVDQSRQSANPQESDFLQIAEELGFLEKQSEFTYQWVHDKIQEACLSRVPTESLPIFKFRIGEVLMNNLDEKQLESKVFVIANLLNDGAKKAQEYDRIKIATLNMLAAKKSLITSAFESAHKYCRFGIENIRHIQDRWTSHYNLTLDLYSSAAESEIYLEMVESMMDCCNEVIANTEGRPLMDKMRVYSVMIQHAAGSMKYQEACDQIVELLRQFGVKLPRRKISQIFGTLKGILKAKRKIKSLDPSKIVTTSTDQKYVEILKLLNQLTTYNYLCESKIYMPLAIMASVKVTLEHGASEYSPPMFGYLGMMLSGLVRDYDTGTKCGKISLDLLEKLGCKNTESKTLLVAGVFVRCWSEPVSNLCGSLFDGYKVGLATGDIESASLCVRLSICMGLQCGTHLGQLEADIRIYADQIISGTRVHGETYLKIYWLYMMGLMNGGNEFFAPMHGTEPTTPLENLLLQNPNDQQIKPLIQSFMCRLYAINGDHDKCAKLALELGEGLSKKYPALFPIMPDTFSRALSLYAVSRKTKKSLYKRHAKKAHATIKRWVKCGNPNVAHLDKLLDAESAVLLGDFDLAEGWYQSSITLASRAGFNNDAALANERYGDFLLNCRNDAKEATFRFQEACRLYLEWGAHKKVRALQEKCDSLWKPPEAILLPEAASTASQG